MHAETYGDQTSLTIDVTEREDTGNYKIVLQNEAGEATASVKIKVVGKSSKTHESKLHFTNWFLDSFCCVQTYPTPQRLLWSQWWVVTGAQ